MGADLACVIARQRPRLVAHLARHFGLGHWATAEDAVQQACVQALACWPADGVPDNPAGWLWRVAQRELIDQLRRAGRDEPLLDDADAPAPVGGDTIRHPLAVAATSGRLRGELDDDELALLFAACHPALPLATQVALALRAATSLELAAIAEGLLSNESALAQRLARARALLRDADLTLPAGADLVPRRRAVLATLQLMFTLGMKAAGRSGAREPSLGAMTAPQRSAAGPANPRCGGMAGDATGAVAPDAAAGAPADADVGVPPDVAVGGTALCWEAVRLARALAAHPVTAGGDADALAALLLLHGARLTGRLDAHGDIVPLAGQPRDRWDASLVRLGLAHLDAARRADALSTWHLQAGIAAEHACARDYAATDWRTITTYYDALLRLDPSPAPRLGHAIALAEGGGADGRAGPARAVALLLTLLADVPRPLRAHTLAALSRAHERLGQLEPARQRLREAIAAATHAADARLLERRLRSIEEERSR